MRTKASFEKVDPELLRQSLWTVCSLSRKPLTPPVASDPLGKLYNKEALVEQLLSRHVHDASSSARPDPIAHIRGLKDITELRLSPNALYRPPSSSPTSSSDGGSVYPFACPLSGKQMDGKQRFVYLATCGCAMSLTGLHVTLDASDAPPEQTPCPVCGETFNAAGLAKGKQPEAGGSVVTINPSHVEENEMREALNKARAVQASKKKAKTRSADQTHVKDDANADADKKRRKAEKKAERSAKIAALTAELAAEQA